MPKEIIRDRRDMEHSQPFRVEVGFDRDHDMRIGVALDSQSGHLLDLLAANPRVEQIVGAIITEAMRVQITEDRKSDRTGEPLDFTTSEQQENFHRHQTRMVVSALREHTPEWNSVWFEFPDRRDVNALILVLRKARDAVFGKDQ